MNAADPVLYELRDSGVAVLTLNRPERMNGWGGGLAARFYALLDEAEADENVRAVVVTGAGRAFCVGADMGDLSSIEKADTNGETDVSTMVGFAYERVEAGVRMPGVVEVPPTLPIG